MKIFIECFRLLYENNYLLNSFRCAILSVILSNKLLDFFGKLIFCTP